MGIQKQAPLPEIVAFKCIGATSLLLSGGVSKFIAVQSYAHKGDTASGSWRMPSQHWVWDSFSWEGQWGQMCWATRQFTYGRVSWLIQCGELPSHLISRYEYDCRFYRMLTVLILFHAEGIETIHFSAFTHIEFKWTSGTLHNQNRFHLYLYRRCKLKHHISRLVTQSNILVCFSSRQYVGKSWSCWARTRSTTTNGRWRSSARTASTKC